MLKLSHWYRMATLLLALLLAACGGGGGGSGSSTPAPTGFTVTPGNNQVTVTWNADPGVTYWLMYAATATPIDLKNPPANHAWTPSNGITSPHVLTNLTNGVTYSFAMNGRTSGAAGGAQTASVSVLPKTAGSNWMTGTTTLGSGNVRGVAYGTASDSTVNYLAVGAGGAIYKALEGVSQGLLTGMVWSTVTPVATINFNAATYAFGKFIAVGDSASNNIYTSTDTTTWTAATTSVTTKLNAVASNGTTVVAVGDAGVIYSSTDGSAWTAVATTASAQNLYGVTYSAAGYWVAVGQGGAIVTSSDLVTWTLRYNTGLPLRSVTASSGNVFVAVGDSGTFVKSNDGINWTAQTAFSATTLYAVSTDSVQFVAVGQSGKAYTSTDGATWTAAPSTSSAQDLFAVVGSASKYVAVGAAGANISSIN